MTVQQATKGAELYPRKGLKAIETPTESLVGLFDFPDYSDLVSSVSHVLKLGEEEVWERLFNEALQTGWNVSRAAGAVGVTPHIFDKRMEKFYSQTDAFVFELLVGHLNQSCKEIDRRVSVTIQRHFDGRKNLKILVFGDGVGTDSLRLAAVGHRTTYFEFEGASSAMASYRFQRLGLGSRITVLHKIDEIPREWFDVVICREVLEHVPDPLSIITSIRKCLKWDGIAIITESFSRIEPTHPTHLARNEKYDGRTEWLFVRAGFHFLYSFPSKRPMVFQKVDERRLLRYCSLLRKSFIRGLVGRFLLRQIRSFHRYRTR